MRFLILLLPLFLCTACGSYTAGLPANPDPNKCYVRMVSQDVYHRDTLAVLTYTEDEAFLYPHKKERIELKPEISRWETTTATNCESDDPNDCQVLCYRTYPAEYLTVYVPEDTAVGNPLWQEYKLSWLVDKGRLVAYEEIDCEFFEFSVIPVEFAPESAALSAANHSVVEYWLLDLLLDRPHLRIEVNAHTSSRGSAAQNQDLSERRANSIADFLVSRGIERGRLSTRGYGESRLTNRCADGVDCTEEEHRANERIEWRVVNLGK